MAQSDQKEGLYSVIALFFMIISIGLGGFFYITRNNTAETMTLPVAMDEKAESTPQPQRPTPDIVEKPSMKIAIPNQATGLLTDIEGRQTGIVEGAVVNDIPFSEYSPDEIAGTVTWIVVSEPQLDDYSLRVLGSSDKAVAVYLKGETGENLELIDISDHRIDEKTYTINVDPTIPSNPIVVQ